ncbi:MAG: biotin/lipoyl-containing protein, partial [Qipengyuania vulgaris]
MPTPIKMPALSPTMEEGTLAKWLVKPGDTVSAGDIMAEIETDKATMEFEAVDEGTIASIMVDEGTEGVKVGTVIAMLAEEGEDLDEAAKAAPSGDAVPVEKPVETKEEAVPAPTPAPAPAPAAGKTDDGNRIKASPLARRIAE